MAMFSSSGTFRLVPSIKTYDAELLKEEISNRIIVIISLDNCVVDSNRLRKYSKRCEEFSGTPHDISLRNVYKNALIGEWIDENYLFFREIKLGY